MYNLDIKLNQQQINAVEDIDGQVLVLAGAGSGKTRVLTARIAYLIKQCGVDPYNILAITFTNKAAKEMLSRINDILDGNSAVWAKTFHSFCALILRYNANRLGYTDSFTIYDENDATRLLKRICTARNVEDNKQRDRIIQGVFQAKCFCMPPAKFRLEYAALKDIDLICDIYEEYQNELFNNNAMDFDDLLQKTVELFVQCPDILAKYQERFRYILVDEFQDTNPTQYLIIKLLGGKYGNIFVVGDEDQSIYSWRGADINNILNFSKDFRNARVYKLEQNYRSTPAVLRAANRIIANNKQRFGGKNLWTEVSGGEQINICNCSTDRDEADYVVKQISYLLSEGYKYSDIAVLTRVNALTRPFEERLNLYGMPYKVFGGFKFYERKEVKDILAYLRLACNPKDTESILRVINFPKRGIGEGAVNSLLEYCQNNKVDLVDAILEIEGNTYLSSATIKKIAIFKDIVVKLLAEKNKMRPHEFIEYVVRLAAIEEYYKSAKDEEADRFENVVELVGAVKEFQRDNPDAHINEFLQSVALVSDTDGIQDDNYISIATVHAVKGLEFAAVFIVALEEGIFPLQRAVDENQVEEERRLMYVAVTRAQKRLFCTSALRRFRFNQVQYNLRSRFVSEMQGEQNKTDVASKATIGYQKPSYAKGYENSPHAVRQNGWVTTVGQKPVQTAATPKVLQVDFSEYVAGKKVRHKKFGEGLIIETYGEGVDKSALINFEGVGSKKFLLLIANLELV